MRRMLSICLLFCCSPAVIYAQIRFTDPAPIAGVADLFVARLGEGVQPLLYVNQGDGGRVVGSGVCFYRLQSGGRVLTQSMVLLPQRAVEVRTVIADAVGNFFMRSTHCCARGH